MRSLLLMMMLAPFAWAELKIEGNEKVAVYKTVRLKATGAAPDAAYIWDVDKEGDIDADESGAKFSFSAPPGVYRIKLRSVSLKDGKTTIETARFSVTVGPDLPDPKPFPPDPGPGPKPPDPPPALKQLWVVVIEETADAAETRGALFRDKALADRMRARGHKFRVADQDVKTADGRTPADVAPWIERAKKAGLPRLFLVDQDGNALHEAAVPATAADLRA